MSASVLNNFSQIYQPMDSTPKVKIIGDLCHWHIKCTILLRYCLVIVSGFYDLSFFTNNSQWSLTKVRRAITLIRTRRISSTQINGSRSNDTGYFSQIFYQLYIYYSFLSVITRFFTVGEVTPEQENFSTNRVASGQSSIVRHNSRKL